MSKFSFVLLYVDNPPASATFYADLLGTPPVETSPTFAMLPLGGEVMLGLWSRRTVEPVATAEHVEIGRSAGFLQVCHGKATPLRRVQPGDRVVYYSPNRIYSPSHASREKDRLQAFTAIGTVKQGAPYQADMGFGFQPYRRDVDWHDAQPTPIATLQDALAFMQD